MPQPPVVVDLGKKSKKRLKDLKAGAGPTHDEVLATIEQVKKTIGAEASGKTFVPFVLVYRKKQKKSATQRLMSAF